MTNWKILITAPYLLPIIDKYRDYFAERGAEYVKADVEERLEEDKLLPLIGDFDGVIAGDDRFTARVFDAAKRLKVLVKWGTGIDSFDVDAARSHGVVVCRTVDAFTDPVADSVLGYILCSARNIAALDRNMKEGRWHKVPGRALNESTIGIVGIGATGSAVARRAVPFGARLLGVDLREIHPGHLRSLQIEMVSFEKLLNESDFISINCDLNPTTHPLFSDAEFAKMKKGAFIINCARGPIVDEAALVRALSSGHLAGAALDVFEHEPLPQTSPLRRMQNVLLAPHNSNSSVKAWNRVHENSLAMLFDALRRT